MRAAARASLSSASACSWNASRVSSSTMRCSSAVDMRSADADGAAAADPVVRQAGGLDVVGLVQRSEEQTSELQSLMRISYAVFCLKKKINSYTKVQIDNRHQ